jgi:hypothetical protein
MEPEGSVPCSQQPTTGPSRSEEFVIFHNKIILYGELSAPRPTFKLEDHPFSTVRDCLFNIFAATPMSGGRLLRPQPEAAPCRGGKGPT